MSDKTTKKFLILLLLLNITLAAAFNLFLKSNNAAADNNIQAEKKPAGVQWQPAKFPDTSLKTKPVALTKPVELSEHHDGILSSATNEDEVLDELRAWARKDPEAALIWGQQQTNNAERNEALTDACFQIAQTDPKRAMMLAQQFNLNKDAVTENLAQLWAAKDLTTASNWILAQPAGDQRDAMVTGMTFVWSQTQPADAAQFVVDQIQPGSAQDEAVMMVLHQWALTDPTAAGAWVQQFPDSPLRTRALNELKGIAQYKQDLVQSK